MTTEGKSASGISGQLSRSELLATIKDARVQAQIERDREHLPKRLRDFIASAWTVLKPAEEYKTNWHIDAICEHLEAVSRFEISRLQVWVPPGSMKPVDVDALVLMGDGSRRRLGDIKIGDRVITHSGKPRDVLDIAEQGVLPTLLITTESGRSVRAAADHPFLTPSGWKLAGDLVPGDTLGTVVAPDFDQQERHTDEEMRMVGYFVGDGNCTYGKSGGVLASNVTCVDPIQGADIVACAEAMGWEANYSEGSRARRYNIRGGCRPWLRDVGLAGHGSWTKTFPDFVFTSPTDSIAQCIGAYFACDGTIGHWREKRSAASIIFNSVNRTLLSDTQHLLLRLGVKSRLREHVSRRNNFTNGTHLSWRLPITSTDDTSKFIESIPAIGAKAERLRNLGIQRTRFDETIQPDRVISVDDGGERECRCLNVDVDHSFTANDLIVKNTLTVSVMWPCWEWTSEPGLRYWTGSYQTDLSLGSASMCLTLMESEWYRQRWGDKFTFNSTASHYFTNDQGGTRLSTSPDSKGTGYHGHRIIVDDPLRARDADRDSIAAANQWYDSTIQSRGIPWQDHDHARVLIMQRLHPDDLAAHMLEQEEWEVLCLPERYERRHPYAWVGDPRRDDGELLWPAMRNEKSSNAMAKGMTSHRAAGQLQQRPSSPEGEILKRSDWRFYDSRIRSQEKWDELPKFTMVIQTVDTPLRDKESNDNIAIQVWGVKGADRYLLDLDLGKMNYAVAKRRVKEMAFWARRSFPRSRHFTLIENAGYGSELITDLKREITGVMKISPSQMGDKVMRATTASDALESHNCFLPGFGPPWQPVYDEAKTPDGVARFVANCAQFPNAAHDDDVDAWSQMVNWLRGKQTTPMRTHSAHRVGSGR